MRKETKGTEIKIRISESDKSAIYKAASKSNKNVSEYIRSRIVPGVK